MNETELNPNEMRFRSWGIVGGWGGWKDIPRRCSEHFPCAKLHVKPCVVAMNHYSDL